MSSKKQQASVMMTKNWYGRTLPVELFLPPWMLIGLGASIGFAGQGDRALRLIVGGGLMVLGGAVEALLYRIARRKYVWRPTTSGPITYGRHVRR